MTTDVMSNQVLVLCDYDPLYGAIELKLSGLSHVRVIRRESNGAERPASTQPTGDFDLIIVAPMPPTNDPMRILSQASLLNQVGLMPLVIISEQPSQPESDDRITHLNFPFDMDDLPRTVSRALEANRNPDLEHAI